MAIPYACEKYFLSGGEDSVKEKVRCGGLFYSMQYEAETNAYSIVEICARV